jgi:cell division septation protein DedD
VQRAPLPQHVLFLASSALLVLGCAAEEKVQQVPPPSPRTVEFETTTDTVYTKMAESHSESDNDSLGPGPRYAVQIGAFKDPSNASRLQATTRSRYHLPVINNFHTTYALYQIRIGFFESREEANAFRSRIQAEYPSDYGDSWVVQVKR